MSTDQRKSSSENRLDAIIDALTHANLQAKALSECTLNRMPEYFMAIKVAEYFAQNFKNFGYRLEASVQGTLQDAAVDKEEIIKLLKDDDLRGNGRFDLVLRTGKKGLPAHILEFKRGSRREHLLKDLIRLAYVCEKAPERSRLETNYLVFITRQSKGELREMLKEQERNVSKKHLRNGVVYRLGRYQEIDYWMNTDFQPTTKRLSVAVFEVRFKA